METTLYNSCRWCSCEMLWNQHSQTCGSSAEIRLIFPEMGLRKKRKKKWKGHELWSRIVSRSISPWILHWWILRRVISSLQAVPHCLGNHTQYSWLFWKSQYDINILQIKHLMHSTDLKKKLGFSFSSPPPPLSLHSSLPSSLLTLPSLPSPTPLLPPPPLFPLFSFASPSPSPSLYPFILFSSSSFFCSFFSYKLKHRIFLSGI